MTNLSDDARVLISAWFAWGEKTKVTVGGRHAQSILTPRAEAAIEELVAGGYVVAEPFNDTGRMTYIGTDKCSDGKLSFSQMEKLGGWPATMPNPERRP